MKFIYLFILAAFSLSAFAQETERQTPCDTPVFHRPGGASVKEAKYEFVSGIDEFLNRCAVQKELPSEENLNIIILGFVSKGTKTSMNFLVRDFSAESPTERECKITRDSKVESYINEDGDWDGRFIESVSKECSEPKLLK